MEQLAAQAKRAKTDDQRAQLDKQVEGEQRALQETLVKLLNVLGLQVPEEVTPPVVLTFKYTSTLPKRPTAADRVAGFTREGFRDQLEGQERGLNAMTVGQWRTNRDRYIERGAETGSGRDPIADALQKEFRKEQRAGMIFALRAKRKVDISGLAPAAQRFVQANTKPGGLPSDAATQVVDNWLATQAALHDPDQVAGGHPAGLKDMGSSRINKSIGSQWGNTQAALLDQGIDNRLNEVPRPLWDGIDMKKTGKGGVRLKI